MSALGRYARALALVAVVAAAGVVADPAHRATTLRVALVAVVLIAVVGGVQLAARRLPPATASPFDPPRPRREEPIVPVELSRLAADLELYAAPGGSRLGSGTADRLVRDLVDERRDQAPSDRSLTLGPTTLHALERRRAADPQPLDPLALATELEAL